MAAKQFTEQELLQGIHNNSLEVYRYLYQEMTPVIYHDVVKNAGTKEDAEDLFQEVIVIVTENVICGKYREGNLKGYIRQVAANQWHKELRKNTAVVSSYNVENTQPVDNNSLKHQEEMKQEEKRDLVRAKIEELGESCRKLLRRFYDDGLSLHSIAEEMGTSQKYCKKRIYVCRQQLKRLLEGNPAFKDE